MEHYLLISNVAVVVLVGIKRNEHCFIIFGVFNKAVLLFGLVSSIEDDVMLALEPILVALDVSNKDEFGVFGGVDIVPLLHQQCFGFFMHGLRY